MTETATLPTSAAPSAAMPPRLVRVGLIMGSHSDWAVLSQAAEQLQGLEIGYEARVVSAHRTPLAMVDYAQSAAGRGLHVLIAGAGGAAHLPGMVAALTTLPVLGVPVPAQPLQGLDALLSIVQMPRGVPVGTLAIGASGAANAALLAAAILALHDEGLRQRLQAYRAARRDEVLSSPVPSPLPTPAVPDRR